MNHGSVSHSGSSPEAALAKTSRPRSGPRSGRASGSRRRRAGVHQLLRAAYKQLLSEVPPGPSTKNRARFAAPTFTPKRPASTEQPRQGAAPARDRSQRPDPPPDSNWQPDLVLTAGVGRDGGPAPPPDPEWQADFVLLDEISANIRAPQPPKSNWQPDAVLPSGRALGESRDAALAAGNTRENYRSLFERMAARSTEENRVNWESPWMRAIGIVVLAALVAGNIWWLWWIAWSDDPAQAARAPAEQATPAR